MSPPVPTSEVIEATSRCSRDDLAQVALEPGRALEVADHAGDLDLVHREDHRAGAAAAAQLEAGRGDRLEGDAAAAELARGRGRERLLRPAARRRSRPGSGRSRSTSSAFGAATSSAIRRIAARNAWSRSSAMLMRRRLATRPARAAIETTLSKTLRLSIESRNSMSKAVLERDHHVDARVGGHAGLVEVGVIVERRHVHRQVAVLTDDLSDPFSDARSIIQTHLIPCGAHVKDESIRQDRRKPSRRGALCTALRARHDAWQTPLS